MPTVNELFDGEENEIQHAKEQIFSTVEVLQALSKEAVIQYKDIVNSILNGKITSDYEIERVMDGMLSFCQFDEMLLLFKQLCRGLYFKYPELVHNYVSYYREMCDEESLDSKL